MFKIRCSAVGMFLIAALVISSLPGLASAGNGPDQPIKLHAVAFPGPIGSVEALGPISIDGRQAGGGKFLWGGELIEAPAGTIAPVSLDAVGRVTLAAGTAVRLSSIPSSDDQSGKRLLIARLLRGNIAVDLSQEAGAYVEAPGASFSALRGANFRVSVEEGRAVLHTVSGTIETAVQASRPNYKIRPVDQLGRPVDLGRTLSVRARSTRNFQIQVTDENDKPIPDLPILFSLSDPCLGSLGVGAGAGTNFKKNTDRKGIAAVPFIIGAAKCLGSLSAKVEGTSTEFVQQVQVEPKEGFWNTRNSLVVALIAGAATAGIVLAATSGGDNEPIRPVPPPVVKP